MNMSFDNLPKEVQSEVKSILGAFPRCFVEKDTRGFHVLTGICLHDGVYREQIGEYKGTDILTREEWIAAYKENFGYAPSKRMIPSEYC